VYPVTPHALDFDLRSLYDPCVAGPRLESEHRNTTEPFPFSIFPFLSFPRNRIDQRGINVANLRVGKEDGGRIGLKMGERYVASEGGNEAKERK
jgi:hypothetical protein